MTKILQRVGIMAATLAVTLSSSDAFAAAGSNFSTIAQNITTSIGSLPFLLSALSYMFGIMLGALGILKIKDHVENPGQTHLKDGAVRLAAGGGLLALPIVYNSMKNTIGNDANANVQSNLNKVTFGGN